MVVNQPKAVLRLRAGKIQNEKPEVIEYLKNDAFSLNRTGKPFSSYWCGIGVDNQCRSEKLLESIMAFGDINSAVNRWQVTSSMKTQIIKKPSWNDRNKEL